MTKIKNTAKITRAKSKAKSKCVNDKNSDRFVPGCGKATGKRIDAFLANARAHRDACFMQSSPQNRALYYVTGQERAERRFEALRMVERGDEIDQREGRPIGTTTNSSVVDLKMLLVVDPGSPALPVEYLQPDTDVDGNAKFTVRDLLAATGSAMGVDRWVAEALFSGVLDRDDLSAVKADGQPAELVLTPRGALRGFTCWLPTLAEAFSKAD